MCIFFYYDEGKSKLYFTGVQRKKRKYIIKIIIKLLNKIQKTYGIILYLLITTIA